MTSECHDEDLIAGLRSIVGARLLFNLSSCDVISDSHDDVIEPNDDDGDDDDGTHVTSDPEIISVGLDVYAFLTPVIIVVGILGNGVALRVFLSRRMRKMSASLYLACLAVSDICVLVAFVLVEWLDRGLVRWPGARRWNPTAVRGVCQGYVFAAYAFRFTSAWIIVAFTVERYLGICRPLWGRVRSKRAFARRSLGAVVLVAVSWSLWKPLMMTVQVIRGVPICSSIPEYHFVSFVLDSLYAGSITVIPFVIMVTLNLLICRKLRRTKRRYIRHRFVTEENRIRMEFTAILLLVSSLFIVLNVPYFVAWSHRFLLQLNRFTARPANVLETERSRGWVHVTKTVFFCNYCVNFFVYSLSGAYFRRQLRRHVVACCRRRSTCSSESDRPDGFMVRHHRQNSQTSLPVSTRV